MNKQPYFHISDSFAQKLFMGRKAKQAATRQFREGPIYVFENISSTDPEFLKFKDKASREFTKLADANVDEYGRVYGNGIRSNFYGMRHLNGFGMLPATWPLVDNSKAREAKGLTDKFEEQWHENVFEAIIRLFFSDLAPVPLKYRKGSSSCIPYFVNNMDAKKELGRRALRDAQAAGELMLKGDYEKAFTMYHFGGAYYVVYRDQSSDKVTVTKQGVFEAKQREIADFEYAISGGQDGRQYFADKEPGDIGTWVPKGFFRARRRTAMGGPLALNTAMMPIAQSVRASVYDRYAFSYHHTTRADQESQLRKKEDVIAADVSNHDILWPSSFYLDKIVATLLDMGFAPWWVELYRVKGRLPVYVSTVGPDMGNTLMGDWTNPNLNVGLHSGNAFTDLEGTMLMTGVYAIAQIEHVFPIAKKWCSTLSGAIQFMDSYMKGEQPIFQKSKSDDALLGIADASLSSAQNEFREKLKREEQTSVYMVLGYEHGGAFLGNILWYGQNKKLSDMVMIGNMNSWSINQFSPEYGVNPHSKDKSKEKRPFPGLAWKSIPQTYGSAPMYGELTEAAEKVWFDTMGGSYRKFREEMLEKDEKALFQYARENGKRSDFDDLTPVELEILVEPDKLQYKYADTDVRKAVSDVVFNGLTIDEVEPFFNSVVPR